MQVCMVCAGVTKIFNKSHNLIIALVTISNGKLNNKYFALPTALKPMIAIFLDFAGMTESSFFQKLTIGNGRQKLINNDIIQLIR